MLANYLMLYSADILLVSRTRSGSATVFVVDFWQTF